MLDGWRVGWVVVGWRLDLDRVGNKYGVDLGICILYSIHAIGLRILFFSSALRIYEHGNKRAEMRVFRIFKRLQPMLPVEKLVRLGYGRGVWQ